jgi:hypothetical protein
MLVMLAGDQLLLPQRVCPSCVLADRTGQPRWQDGVLKCGDRAVQPTANHQFECPMGFRLVAIADGSDWN